MADKLKDLYQEVILKHNNSPFNFEKREDAQFIVEAYNPVCGDQYKLYFDMVDGQIKNLSFHGYGCAISKASASVMTALMQDLDLKEAIQKDELFRTILKADLPGQEIPEDLLAFTSVKKYPGRASCVTLVWDGLKGHLVSKSH